MNDQATRRGFLSFLSVGLMAVAAAVVSVPIVAYLLSPLLRPNPDRWISLGRVDDFSVGETREVAYEDPSPLEWAGQTARTAVWVRRTGPSDFTVFAVNCTHLGCPVNWLATANLFICPCHGGVYYADGRVAGGPPPRRLFEYEWRVAGDNVQLLSRPLPIG